MRPAPVYVPVLCAATFPDGRDCNGWSGDHVHMPLPCRNGNDERHHDFLPPTSILLDVGGQRRYLRFRREGRS